MRTFTFVIIDDNPNQVQKTMAAAKDFPYLTCLGSAVTFDDGVDLVLEQRPDFIFLEIEPEENSSGLSLHFISELHRYLNQIPKIIVTTKNDTLCFSAFKYGVFDYLIHPIATKELRKTLARFEKEIGVQFSTTHSAQVVAMSDRVEPLPTLQETVIEASVDIEQTTIEEADEPETKEIIEEEANSIEVELQHDVAVLEQKVLDPVVSPSYLKPLVICVKSYGDYRYIDAAEICYLQADNNSTDIHLNTGEMITAFKTLKHFEGVLTHPFVRIHNSYIVNIDFIARIHTGNSVCHLKNSTVKLPFSKSYKENIDQIINSIASGNYLEI